MTISLWGRERRAHMDFRLQPTNASAALTFGPVIERTINPTDRQRDRFLDLDTGKLYDAPSAQEVKSDNVAELKAWAARQWLIC